MNERSWLAWLWYGIMWCPCYAASQVLFRFKCTGKHHVPLTGPVLLVSNHQSNLDPILVGLACPRQLKYLARKGLFFFPFNHWIRALARFLSIRKESALAGIRATLGLLKENNAVLVFPEGSRSSDGQLHKMLAGFCILARRSHATIVPLALEGAFAALPRGAILVKPHSIRLKFTDPITPAQFQKLTDAQLTDLVAERISQALAETRRELETDPYFAGFLQPKRENLLLASRPEPAYAADGHI